MSANFNFHFFIYLQWLTVSPCLWLIQLLNSDINLCIHKLPSFPFHYSVPSIQCNPIYGLLLSSSSSHNYKCSPASRTLTRQCPVELLPSLLDTVHTHSQFTIWAWYLYLFASYTYKVGIWVALSHAYIITALVAEIRLSPFESELIIWNSLRRSILKILWLSPTALAGRTVFSTITLIPSIFIHSSTKLSV